MHPAARRRDLILGLVGIMTGTGFGYAANALTYPSKVFPLAVCIAIVVLCALIALRALFWPAGPRTENTRFLPSIRSFLVVVTAVSYVWTIPILGFYVSSFICIMVISILTETETLQPAILLRSALAATIFLAVIYAVFSHGFNSTISGGILF